MEIQTINAFVESPCWRLSCMFSVVLILSTKFLTICLGLKWISSLNKLWKTTENCCCQWYASQNDAVPVLFSELGNIYFRHHKNDESSIKKLGNFFWFLWALLVFIRCFETCFIGRDKIKVSAPKIIFCDILSLRPADLGVCLLSSWPSDVTVIGFDSSCKYPGRRIRYK